MAMGLREIVDAVEGWVMQAHTEEEVYFVIHVFSMCCYSIIALKRRSDHVLHVFYHIGHRWTIARRY